LFEQNVHACRHQSSDQEIVAVQGVGKHHITWAKALEQRARQPEFAGAFASVWSHRRASGKTTPGAWVLGWRYTAWFCGVSGIEIPVPSINTVRPRQSHYCSAFSLSKRPVSRMSALTVSNGKRQRAGQYSSVRTPQGECPSAGRCAAQPLTAFWHEPSASSTWRMNIDSATVSGYSRSRCSGSTDPVVSSNVGLVSTLKNSTASVVFARRAIVLRR